MISILGLPDYLPKVSNKVRVTNTKGRWILQPQNDDTVKVTYQQYADPGGNFPNWIIKLYSVNIPYKALNCLRKQVKLTKYQDKTTLDKLKPIGKVEASYKMTAV